MQTSIVCLPCETRKAQNSSPTRECVASRSPAFLARAGLREEGRNAFYGRANALRQGLGSARRQELRRRNSLIYIDRHLVQEVSSPQAFAGLMAENRAVRRPDAHVAVADHAVPTRFRSNPLPDGLAARQVSRLDATTLGASEFPISRMRRSSARHRPCHRARTRLHACRACTLVCGDSHTCTHGAFGAIAFGIGSSECECVFATQTLRQRKQKRMRVTLTGDLHAGVSVKDIILALIAEIGVGGGIGSRASNMPARRSRPSRWKRA